MVQNARDQAAESHNGPKVMFVFVPAWNRSWVEDYTTSGLQVVQLPYLRAVI